MIRDIYKDGSSLWRKPGKAYPSTTRKQGAGVCDFSGALLSFRFMVWIFVRSHTSGCGFGVYRAASFAADQILTGV